MSTALSRTGPTSGTPVLPPLGVASATAAVQAAWAALAAYYHRLRCGTGEYIDFSRFEAVVQSLDPPFGSEGQAAVGLKRSSELWRGRPRNQQIYPIFPCTGRHTCGSACCRRDSGGGCARGSANPSGSPTRSSTPSRPAMRRHANSTRPSPSCSPRRRWTTWWPRVSVAVYRSPRCSRPAEALASEHFRAVGALADVDLAADAAVSVPVGPFVVDGAHAGYATPRQRSVPTKPLGRRPPSDPSAGRHGRAAVRRPADPRPRRDRRRRRTGPAVRRPRRGGHQGRERRVSRRPAPDARRVRR